MHVCLLMPCGHLLGKGWPLGSHLWCLIVTLSLSHWYPRSGVVLDCIDSWSLPSFLLCSRTQCSDADEVRARNPWVSSQAIYHWATALHLSNLQELRQGIFTSEMLTINGALQEYERHFSGIWEHFPECGIFCHKSTKCTHTSDLYNELQYCLIQYPLPPSRMHGWELYLDLGHNISLSSTGFSKGQKFV